MIPAVFIIIQVSSVSMSFRVMPDAFFPVHYSKVSSYYVLHMLIFFIIRLTVGESAFWLSKITATDDCQGYNGLCIHNMSSLTSTPTHSPPYHFYLEHILFVFVLC